MELIPDELEQDYNLGHSDIKVAKEIEPLHNLFKLFSLRNPEMITLCLAAVRTLARETNGIFSREEMDHALSYLTQSTRLKVINKILYYNWIVSNGIKYEFPENLRYMMMFLFGPLAQSSDSFKRDIELSFAISDLDEVAGSNDETAETNLQVAFGTLRRIRSQFLNVLEQKSPMEAQKLLVRSKDIHTAMNDAEAHLRERNRESYNYSQTTELRDISSEIIRLSQELHVFIQQDIQANARSFGQYLTPEQIEEFLQKASVERLARLINNRFASPLKPFFLAKEELERRGIGYLEHKPEKQEPTPPPPVVPIVKREAVINNQEGSANSFYRELMTRLSVDPTIPLHNAVVKNNFGESLFRTGLLVAIKHELSEEPERVQFNLTLEGIIEQLAAGPVQEITRGVVELISEKISTKLNKE